MGRKLKEPNTDQLLLDLAENRERLEAVRRAVAAIDQCDGVVRELSGKLSMAKRKAKEARWNLASLVSLVRRKPKGDRETTTSNGEAVPQ